MTQSKNISTFQIAISTPWFDFQLYSYISIYQLIYVIALTRHWVITSLRWHVITSLRHCVGTSVREVLAVRSSPLANGLANSLVALVLGSKFWLVQNMIVDATATYGKYDNYEIVWPTKMEIEKKEWNMQNYYKTWKRKRNAYI